MKVTETLRAFLKDVRSTHYGPDLIDFYMAHPGLETQINVAAGNGWPVDGKRATYTDGVNEWWSIRIPRKANSTPEWDDYELRWPIERHAEGIGSTGWDWQERCSRYVGFDFDAVAGHARGVGLTDAQLLKVQEAAQSVPWVTVRKSTSGTGIHLYVYLSEGFPTNNHTEHAALARCILGMISAEARVDLQASVDTCGGNLWIWHRKTQPGSDGLALIKMGERLPVSQIPANWRDHVKVITRVSPKVPINGIEAGDVDLFDQLSSSYATVPLEDAHKEHIEIMQGAGFMTTWVQDRNMLQGHTVGFLRVAEQLPILGAYKTLSQGSDPSTPNCFAFPAANGAWKIYRFSPGIAEESTWEQDGNGWTTCWFNRPPTFELAAKYYNGIAIPKKGYEFESLEQAAQVVALLGGRLEVDPTLRDRRALLYPQEDGQIRVQVEKQRDDPSIPGWSNATSRRNWTQIINYQQVIQESTGDWDHVIRCLKTTLEQPAGWAAFSMDGKWLFKSPASVRNVLLHLGLERTAADQAMGFAELNPWKLVTIPFAPEYPGNRTWNYNAPQFAFPPAARDSELTHPHWDLILNHIGRDLTKPLQSLEWAMKANIKTGADYLRAWFANIIREPRCRLPYLFLFGPENSGKSILWESFELLLTSGVVKADRALTNQNDFNAELAGAILCVVEEKNISGSPGAEAKIKDAITGLTISIRKMRTDSYMAPNLTHWIQTANTRDSLAVSPGDTRIVVMYVHPIASEIPKLQLLSHLRQEGPAFLRTLLDMDLPSPRGRLSLPVVDTFHKTELEAVNASPLETFVMEHYAPDPNSQLPFSTIYNHFIAHYAVVDSSLSSTISPDNAWATFPVRFPRDIINGVQTVLNIRPRKK